MWEVRFNRQNNSGRLGMPKYKVQILMKHDCRATVAETSWQVRGFCTGNGTARGWFLGGGGKVRKIRYSLCDYPCEPVSLLDCGAIIRACMKGTNWIIVKKII